MHDDKIIMKLTVHDLLLTLASKITFPFSKSYSHSSIVLRYAQILYELWTAAASAADTGSLTVHGTKKGSCERKIFNIRNILAFQKLAVCSLLHCCIEWLPWRIRQRREQREIKIDVCVFFLFFFSSSVCVYSNSVYYNNLIEWNGSRALWFLVCLRSAVYCLIQYFSLKEVLDCDFIGIRFIAM